MPRFFRKRIRIFVYKFVIRTSEANKKDALFKGVEDTFEACRGSLSDRVSDYGHVLDRVEVVAVLVDLLLDDIGRCSDLVCSVREGFELDAVLPDDGPDRTPQVCRESRILGAGAGVAVFVVQLALLQARRVHILLHELPRVGCEVGGELNEDRLVERRRCHRSETPGGRTAHNE